MSLSLKIEFQEEKKWQATHIAPLQPPILAAFRPWGGSAGAGRMRPATANIVKQYQIIFKEWINYDHFKKSFSESAGEKQN